MSADHVESKALALLRATFADGFDIHVSGAALGSEQDGPGRRIRLHTIRPAPGLCLLRAIGPVESPFEHVRTLRSEPRLYNWMVLVEYAAVVGREIGPLPVKTKQGDVERSEHIVHIPQSKADRRAK